MKLLRLPTIVVVGIVLVLAYFATIGWAEPVPDFEPEPTDDPLPSSDPIAFAVFEYVFCIHELNIGWITDITPHVLPYESPDEGQNFEQKTLFALPFPDPPDECKAYLSIRITGPGEDITWQSDRYEIEVFPTNITGQTGRAFFYEAGSYSYVAILTIDTGIIGNDRVLATETGSLEVEV